MSAQETHFRALEALYAGAPCNAALDLRLTITEGQATLQLPVDATMHHAAGAVHGSYCFKLLDDACFFAASSLVPEVFVLTASFTLQLMRPVVQGVLVAQGRVTRAGRTLLFADGTLHDDQGNLLATGTGTFARSSIPLGGLDAYRAIRGA